VSATAVAPRNKPTQSRGKNLMQRNIEKIYGRQAFIAKLCRLTDALECGK